MSKITLTEGAAPSTPSTSQVVIYAKADGLMYSKDDAGAETPLGATPSTDEKAKVSANDTTAGYLNGKLVQGTGITLTENNNGANETLTIACTISDTDEKSKVSANDTTAGYLNGKLVAGTNITLVENNNGANETLTINSTASGGGEIDPITTLFIYEDWVTGNEDADELGSYGWRNSQTGTGTAATRINGESGRPGIMRIGSGTSGTTRSCLHLGESGMHTILTTGFETIFEVSVRLTGTLTTFSRAMIGLGNITSTFGDQTNGIFFSFDKVLGDTTWFIVAENGGVATRNNTSQTVVSGDWYRLRFTVNAAGNSIQAAINGTNVGSAVTTNIPTTAISPLIAINGVAAGSNVLLDNDYIKIKMSGLTR